MPPEATETYLPDGAANGALRFAPTAAASASALRPVAVVGVAAVWGALLVLFHQDWLAMAGQWWNSSTYTHVLLVPPIVGWMLAQRLPALAQIGHKAWWPGGVLFGLLVFMWVLGAFAGFSLVRQAAAVAMLPAAVLAVAGPAAATALAFPLAYMAFLVPFGDEFVPLLQLLTARITIALVHLSGIVARIDGVFIDTPAGLFEVAEACSGVKFLIAMIAFGVLAAHLGFRRWRPRVLLLAACVIVPILANGVRAWGTIAIAQSRGAAWAGGFDHIVYGWIFFALVIAGVLGVAWRHFDRPGDDAMVHPERIVRLPIVLRLSQFGGHRATLVATMMAMAVAGQAWALVADRLTAPMPERIALPAVPGWHRVDYTPLYPWHPRATGADHRLLGRYADAQGRRVDVFVALYARQDEGMEAGGTGEGALPNDGGWSWLAPGPSSPEASGARLLSANRVERLALTTYRTGALTTGSNLSLKAANIADRLLLRARPTTLLIVSAEAQGQHDPAEATQRFRAAVGPLGAWADSIGKGVE